MIQRMPLMNVRYATDRFNWLRRLNDQARVAKLNRDGIVGSKAYNNFAFSHGYCIDWKPAPQNIVPTEINRKCYPPIVAIRRIKVWLFKTHTQVFYNLKCNKCVTTERLTLNHT